MNNNNGEDDGAWLLDQLMEDDDMLDNYINHLEDTDDGILIWTTKKLLFCVWEGLEPGRRLNIDKKMYFLLNC